MKLKAWRTRQEEGGVSTEVDVTIELKWEQDGPSPCLVEMTEGNVTGFEGFYLHPRHKPGPNAERDALADKNGGWDPSTEGWYACAGTMGSWDALKVPGTEMQKLLDTVDWDRLRAK